MNEKRALVTGGAIRLGRAIALRLAEQGYDVAVHYASSDAAARETADEIRAQGRKAAELQADLLVEDEVGNLIDRASDALGGPLNLLVNNASIFEYDRLQTVTRNSWDRHMESNLRAPFHLTQGFAAQAPRATADDAGEPLAGAAIINMIDQRVHKLTPEFMSYTIAKSALWTLTRVSAQALAPDIRVNAIGPGPTMLGTRQSAEHFSRQRSATILQRGADARDVTDALDYLLRARSVTGQMICTDGGQHLAWKTPDILGAESYQ